MNKEIGKEAVPPNLIIRKEYFFVDSKDSAKTNLRFTERLDYRQLV